VHPFACSATGLEAALTRLGVPAPSDVVPEPSRGLTLTLPSRTNGPQPSPQLLRSVEDDYPAAPFDRLDVWEVPVLGVPAAAALDLALALPASPVASVVVGDSLRFGTEAAKLALELVAHGRLRPGLVRQGDQWAARWMAVTDDPHDAERVEMLHRSMPPAVRAQHPDDTPEAVTRAMVDALVDACARELLDGAIDARQDSAIDAGLEALTAEDPVVGGDRWQLAALAEQLDDWWRAGRRYAAQRMFRTCFRLAVPEEPQPGEDGAEPLLPAGEAGEQPPWRVEILL